MITQKKLRSVIVYNSHTGEFVWLVDSNGRVPKGTIAGTIAENGYRVIQINGKIYKAHRLAWLYVYGKMPPRHIDHINLVRSDNRIKNLRLATIGQNKQNCLMQKTNKTGFKGVYRHKSGKFVAKIVANKNVIYLGIYTSPVAAYAAYVTAARIHHGEFARV